MKTKTIISLLVLSLILFLPILARTDCSPPVFVGQVWEDYIVGLDPENSEGFILIDGVENSLTPFNPSDALFPWEDGDYLWGLWGDGKGEGYCPDPGNLTGAHAVVAIVSDTGSTRRFLIQSAWWDDEAYLFNMDDAPGTIQTAGSLTAPRLSDDGKITRSGRTISLAIDLPTEGFADDGSGDPRSLVAGVALVGADFWPGSDIGGWQPLTVISVTPASWPSLQVTISVPEDVHLIAWALIIDDGSARDIASKPPLPMVSAPLALTPPRHPARLLTALTFHSSDDRPALNRISAKGEEGWMTVSWETRGEVIEGSAFEIWASSDGKNFSLQDRVDVNDAVRLEGVYQMFEWQQFMGERSSVGGIYYEVRWVADSDLLIDSRWTRARWRD